MTDPTRYVTPEEFGIGTHYVAGCPRCGGTGVGWLGRTFGGVRLDAHGDAPVTRWPRCGFCKGWRTALFEKQPDGSFKAKPVRRLPV